MCGWSSIRVVVPWNFPLYVAYLEGKDNQHSLSGDTNLFVNMSCQVYLLNQKSEVYTLVFCSV